MNTQFATKVAVQVADSAIVLAAFAAQFTQRHGQRLFAICQDQARQDWAIAQPALVLFAKSAARELDLIVDDFQNDAYDALATVFQALMLLPDFYYFMVECLDHEIPVSLEADLKPMGLVKPQLTAPTIAGLLPPAQSSEFPTVEVVAEVVPVKLEVTPVIQPEVVLVTGSLTALVPSTVTEVATLPADWNLDKNGRKLSGAALKARQRKYGLA
jgi:hypothetical protein